MLDSHKEKLQVGDVVKCIDVDKYVQEYLALNKEYIITALVWNNCVVLKGLENHSFLASHFEFVR